MAKESKCIKCNSAELEVETILYDKNSGKKIGAQRNLILGSTLIIFGLLCALLGIGVAFDFGSIWIFAGYFTFFAGPLLAYGIELVITYKKANKVNLNAYFCKSCKHEWEKWEDGWDGTQCQKCGKSHVTRYSSFVDSVQHKPLKWIINVYGGLCAIVFGVIGSIAVIDLLVETFQNTSLLEGLFIKLFFAALIILPGWLFMWGVKAILNYYTGKKSKLFEYVCVDCDFEWSIIED